jgi:hypothetical protein
MSSGTAALPCPRISPWPMNSAVMMKIIWLLPPMAKAVVPTQPRTRGWGGVGPMVCVMEPIATRRPRHRGCPRDLASAQTAPHALFIRGADI